MMPLHSFADAAPPKVSPSTAREPNSRRKRCAIAPSIGWTGEPHAGTVVGLSYTRTESGVKRELPAPRASGPVSSMLWDAASQNASTRGDVEMTEDTTVEVEATELLRTLIRNACVNTGDPASGHEHRSVDA